MKQNKYLISIYYNNKFIGYVKDFRLHRNNLYRFNKTKNINKAIDYNDSLFFKLNNLRDLLYHEKVFLKLVWYIQFKKNTIIYFFIII